MLFNLEDMLQTEKVILSTVDSTLLCTFFDCECSHFNHDEVISVANSTYVELRNIGAIYMQNSIVMAKSSCVSLCCVSCF